MSDERKDGPKREYYAHRMGHHQTLSFEQIKSIFKEDIFPYIYRSGYLVEAEGRQGRHSYGKLDVPMFGTWGIDIPSFILKRLRMEKIWPLREFVQHYNLTTLFTVIEFIYDHISEPILWKDSIQKYERERAQQDFRKRVNETLALYCYGETTYELSKDGEIRERAIDGFKKLVEEISPTEDPDNIDDKIRYAVSRFLRYGSTIDEKKDAVRTLGDVLEFLKKSRIQMPKKDDSALFHILNEFSIRHHDKSQLSEYSTSEWYEFFFYLFLASINVLLKLKKYEVG